MPIDKYIGVDGCKAGWFFVAIGPGAELELGIFETIENLWQIYSKAKSILIDIPKGKPNAWQSLKTTSANQRPLSKPPSIDIPASSLPAMTSMTLW